VEGGALAQVVDVGLVGEAEAGDDGAAQALRRGADLGETWLGARVVDAAGGLDQRGVVGGAGGDEPRVDGDAVAADAGAGAEDLDARVAVGEAR
jgi:hypothetical protein